MNLEEWLEKMKEKPDTVWCKSNAYPPNKCRYCNKGLYKRGVYKHSRFLTDINTYCCTACKEERERELNNAILYLSLIQKKCG